MRSLAVIAALIWSTLQPLDGRELTNPFYAFDNGTGRASLTPEAQAEMLKKLGYAGIGYTGTKGIPAMLKALEDRGLKMFSIYTGVTIDDPKPSYDSDLPEAIKQLRGHGTLIMLPILGSAPDGDSRAVGVVRIIADMAAQSGLRVVLYPHVGHYLGRVEDALRVARKAERDNVGVAFNLCHCLVAGDEKNLAQQLKESLPHLFVVSINGADHAGGWDRMIQTLDRGEFDVYGFLRTLQGLGYAGPIGLQCAGLKGDVLDNLSRSMSAWRKFSSRLAAERQ